MYVYYALKINEIKKYSNFKLEKNIYSVLTFF